MSKIAVRGGHNFQAIGAVGLINETVEDRKVKDSVIKYLKQLGHEVLDVTPSDMDSNSDLVYGVNKANNWGADLFVSIHFNKAYNSYTGAIGSECWVYSKSDNFNDEVYAQRIVNGLAGLGFKNRGVKESTQLYELRATKMPSVIVEVCFVEATEDVALYNKLGADAIGKNIAEAISDKKVVVSSNSSQSTSALYRVRKTWADAKSQIFASKTFKGAKAQCKVGYSVFDENGKCLYTNNPAPVGTDEVMRYAENGRFYPNTTIYFRNAPSVSSEYPTQGTYTSGESVMYDTVVIGKKYNWISWVSASTGVRRYMPIKDKQTGESWGKAV